MANPILVAGCPRSGSTMTAGLLYHSGAWGGGMGAPHRENPRRLGNFENIPIRNVVHKLARAMGADPRGQKPMAREEQWAKLSPEEWATQIWAAAEADGYTEGPWFLKHPLIAGAYPFWRAMFPGARWVVVRRAVENIVFSCVHTAYMDAFRTEDEWERWARRYESILGQIVELPEALEVRPSRFLQGNTAEIEQVVKDLGLEWTPRCMSLISMEEQLA